MWVALADRQIREGKESGRGKGEGAEQRETQRKAGHGESSSSTSPVNMTLINELPPRCIRRVDERPSIVRDRDPPEARIAARSWRIGIPLSAQGAAVPRVSSLTAFRQTGSKAGLGGRTCRHRSDQHETACWSLSLS